MKSEGMVCFGFYEFFFDRIFSSIWKFFLCFLISFFLFEKKRKKEEEIFIFELKNRRKNFLSFLISFLCYSKIRCLFVCYCGIIGRNNFLKKIKTKRKKSFILEKFLNFFFFEKNLKNFLFLFFHFTLIFFVLYNIVSVQLSVEYKKMFFLKEKKKKN